MKLKNGNSRALKSTLPPHKLSQQKAFSSTLPFALHPCSLFAQHWGFLLIGSTYLHCLYHLEGLNRKYCLYFKARIT